MIHLRKYRSCYSLYQTRGDQFSDNGDDAGGIGPNTTHLSSHKVYFGTDSRDGGFGCLNIILQHPP